MSKPSKVAQAVSSAGLSLLFIAVYSGCNWVTSQRSDVGTWYYQWERFIPFVPIMIVPYMSIDLFFVLAPFLCRSRSELYTLCKRIALGIVVAGACFLMLPLTLAVPRPQPDGWTGEMFRFLHGFDQPFNLFPSLHITLRTILAEHYSRHTRGFVRIASIIWFSLIGFSTLLTFQHHFADVAGGFVLAAICFYLVREEKMRSPVLPSARIGSYYATGAFVLIVVAWIGSSSMLFFLWPATALLITAAGYWGIGPGIYRKTNGKLPCSVCLLLLPSLIGQHLSLLYYRRSCTAWNRVTPNVWIGAHLNSREAAAARMQGATAVLDLTAEFSETHELRNLRYDNIAILDLTAPTLDQMREAVEFITEESKGGIVYVHCKVGYSRSAAVVGAFLLASGQVATVEEAVAWLRRIRPGIVIRPEARAALERYHRTTSRALALAPS